jgi:hypothetical protein
LNAATALPKKLGSAIKLKIVKIDPAIINSKETSIDAKSVFCNTRDKCHAASAALEYQATNNPTAFVREVVTSNLKGTL